MTPPSAAVSLFLCGDVMTGRAIDQVLPQSVEPQLYESYVKDARAYVQLAERRNGPIPKRVPYAYIWGDALDVWQQQAPDLKLINLETSITTNPEPWPDKGVNYRMHPANIPLLKAAGIDFCSLANNHILDWQREGLLETLQTLQEAELPFSGAGQNLAEARKPAILKTKQHRVIIFAYGYGNSGIPSDWAASPQLAGINLLPDLSPETVDDIRKQVRAVKQAGDVVVFSIHWGPNWGYEIPPRHREFAYRLIDEAGVDVIHGHSSHHPLALEVYQDKLILYGAGDFINDYEGISGHDEYRSDLALMYFTELNPANGTLVSLRMVPLQLKKFRLNHASEADAAWLTRVLDREGEKVGTSVRLNSDGTLSLHW
ncbi:CapA family protein [Botryobacter ruber]|uniref:CapA family protein n=1 Tax=Botryobacter ruber TaxID=2171629 RepID=UPI000E0A3E86|nr:CapA family protein [Botryobacter ruber]